MSVFLKRALCGAAALCASFAAAQAADYSVLHNFRKRGDDGRYADGTPILDRAGNLYGTTVDGGTFDKGTVYRTAPDGTTTILHSFDGADGSAPTGGVIRDRHGNLYGTTYSGGGHGFGVVYKLAPDGTATVLHEFAGAGDGAFSYSALLRDRNGNLFGTSSGGDGMSGFGNVFELAADGTWTVLHSFAGGSSDGEAAYGGLAADDDGNLYGTTSLGGASGNGTAYKVAPDGTTTILHSFAGGSDGANPVSTLLRRASGAIYGTTKFGGAHGQGTIFLLKPNGRERVLYSFAGGADGAQPLAGVVRDAAGNLYGTTWAGGTNGCVAPQGCGTVYALAPDGTETVLHGFTAYGDGRNPTAGLVRDGTGTLFGATEQCCGHNYSGTVFKLVP